MERAGSGAAARRRAPVGLVAVVLALLAGVAALAAHAPVLVHRCLPADGLTGAAGIRLALLRPDADCPSGTLAVGGEPGQVLGLLVLVAVPVVVAHVLTALAAACVLAGAGILLRAVGALASTLAGAVVAALPGSPGPVVDRPRAVVATAARLAVRPVLDAAVPRRGPPLAPAA